MVKWVAIRIVLLRVETEECFDEVRGVELRVTVHEHCGDLENGNSVGELGKIQFEREKIPFLVSN